MMPNPIDLICQRCQCGVMRRAPSDIASGNIAYTRTCERCGHTVHYRNGPAAIPHAMAIVHAIRRFPVEDDDASRAVVMAEVIIEAVRSHFMDMVVGSSDRIATATVGESTGGEDGFTATPTATVEINRGALDQVTRDGCEVDIRRYRPDEIFSRRSEPNSRPGDTIHIRVPPEIRPAPNSRDHTLDIRQYLLADTIPDDSWVRARTQAFAPPSTDPNPGPDPNPVGRASHVSWTDEFAPPTPIADADDENAQAYRPRRQRQIPEDF